jgi:zinc metalloprotease ZmpB
MLTKYDPSLKAMVTLDKKQTARQILHLQEPYASDEKIPRMAAFNYLHQMAEKFNISQPQLKNVHKKVNYFEPKLQEMEMRLVGEKSFFDSVTIDMAQTINNIPIWRKGIAVTLKKAPNRIVHAANNTVSEFKAKLPSAKSIERFSKIFSLVENRPLVKLLSEEGQRDDSETGNFVRAFVAQPKATSKTTPSRLIRGRFYYYQYNAANRQPFAHHAGKSKSAKNVTDHVHDHDHPTIDLPPVNKAIKDGQYYLVAEVTFARKQKGHGMLPWLALIEVETNSILHIFPLTSGVGGKVFVQDPLTSTGDLTNTANNTNAVLNALQTDVVLPHLDAPDGMGVQHLKGTYVEVVEVDGRVAAAPTNPAGTDFDYDTRTNNFAAVNAYYHSSNFFATVESLGFDKDTYFTGTNFPVDIDHADHANVNAHCPGNGAGGIGHAGFGYGDSTNTVDPTIGRAVDNHVHWHEIGGHGVLYGFVDGPNFGFAHSAGDGLAGIQNDPTSQLRELGLIERFRYAPFRFTSLDRWMNRDVTTGWAWGGTMDVGLADFGYQCEQILATCHFRIYRSIGGDSVHLSKRQFASRMATYLILRAISTLTPATNPANALAFCNALMAVDLLDWTSEGISGGAYNKVIRWSFEKQGLFQPVGAPTPVISAGAPPSVDVYIDDGRAGEYQYQPVFWNNTSIWNRIANDAGLTHEDPIEGAVNYAYVKIKNRGKVQATNITVKGYHCLPGAGLVWPNDFAQMGPLAGLPVATLNPDSMEEVIVGPFSWTPNANVYGHDCMLMMVSCAEDPSNVDNFTVGDTIGEWRLVPNDNNVGQRNITFAAGESGETLMASLEGRTFFAGNPFSKAAPVSLEVKMPEILQRAGWKVAFREMKGKSVMLKSGEKKMFTMQVTQGQNFTKAQMAESADKDLIVTILTDGIPMGGMSYRIDPEYKNPSRTSSKTGGNCKEAAQNLFDCLNLGNNKVKNVCVKKVSLDIEIDNDCNC